MKNSAEYQRALDHLTDLMIARGLMDLRDKELPDDMSATALDEDIRSAQIAFVKCGKQNEESS